MWEIVCFFESQLEQFLESPNSVGCGPTLVNLNEKKASREISAAKKKGEDIVLHGVSNKEDSRRNNSNTNNKTKNVAEKMFDNRKGDAIKSRHMWKIKSFQRLTGLKRSYNVRISTRSFVIVTIYNNPSCDCNDFKKNNEKVVCKHILFLVIIVLNGEDLEEQLIKKINSFQMMISRFCLEVKCLQISFIKSPNGQITLISKQVWQPTHFISKNRSGYFITKQSDLPTVHRGPVRSVCRLAHIVFPLMTRWQWESIKQLMQHHKIFISPVITIDV